MALPPSRHRRAALPIAVAALLVILTGAVWLVSRPTSGPSLSAPTTTLPLPSARPTEPPTALSTTLSTTLDTQPVAPTTEVPTTLPPTTAPPPTEPPGPDPAMVTQLQTQLNGLGYSAGPADGRFGARTSSAVLAFEKVEGLQLDGDVGPQVLARLAAPQGQVATQGSAVPRIEIDLQRQVLAVVTAGGTKIFNTSTGNNEPFTWPDGTHARAITPTGHFKVLRRVNGVDDGPLGALYRPLYFYDGWAVHGAGFVPAYPASHGCARVSYADQDWIWDNIPNGTPVIVY